MASKDQWLYRLAKPALFRMDPEKAHALAVKSLRRAARSARNPDYYSELKTEIFGKILSLPLTLAAGFDKYAEFFPALSSFGFAGCEVGSFTPLPQEGNPQPRLWRFPSQKALVNAMGFNNPGITEGLENLGRMMKYNPSYFLPAVSIGKGKETPLEAAAEDYEKMILEINRSPALSRLHYLAVNISSPNTPGLRELQKESHLRSLLSTIRSKSILPFAVKFAPDYADLKTFRRAMEICAEEKVGAVILTNTSSDKTQLPGAENLPGGMSGEPLKSRARMLLREAYTVVGEDLPLIASGGIMTPRDVWDRLLLGATTVQAYTGWVYYGPDLARDSVRTLLRKLSDYGLRSLEELRKNRSSLPHRRD